LHLLKIADIPLCINAHEWVLFDNLKSFFDVNSKPEFTIDIIFKDIPTVNIDKAEIMIETAVELIFRLQGKTYIKYKHDTSIPSLLVINDDWTFCSVYIDSVYDKPDDILITEDVSRAIFMTLRTILIPVLAKKSTLMIHSSSIIWKDRGIVFSAPSGTGKTTHTNIWKQLYGARILDGDVTAVRVENGEAVAYGLPWCGTSNEFLNENVCLDSIVFLEQAKENHIYKLRYEEAVMRILSRAFLLPLNSKMMDLYIDIADKIAKATDCYVLECLPDQSAVELVKKCLEEKSRN